MKELNNEFNLSFEVSNEMIPTFYGEKNLSIWLAQLQNVKFNHKEENKMLRALICSKVKEMLKISFIQIHYIWWNLSMNCF